MTKNGQNMAKMEKIRNIQITDNKEDKFFYFPMISMPCTGLWYWVFQTLKLGVRALKLLVHGKTPPPCGGGVPQAGGVSRPRGIPHGAQDGHYGRRMANRRDVTSHAEFIKFPLNFYCPIFSVIRFWMDGLA